MMGWDEAPLRAAIAALPPEVTRTLADHHFDVERWLEQAARLAAGSAKADGFGHVSSMTAGDLAEPPAAGSAEWQRLTALGEEALCAGQCALVVLAGGMATRMGGVVKALADAIPGRTFLELRLAERAAWGKRVGRTPPLWLMTSHGTHDKLTHALAQSAVDAGVTTFPQRVSLRLTPDAQLFLGRDGQPSLYATGHGDLPDALHDSGLLDEFVKGGGRYVMVCNIDNLGAGLDPLLIGMHLDGKTKVSCEVVDKLDNDKGGIPVRVGERAVILEEFLLPAGFDPTQVRVFNSNTMAFDARALLDLRHEWTYFEVHKKVEEREVVQFERLIHESTFWLPTRYLHVPRSGTETRFLPCKDLAELEARRPAIEALAQVRGML